MANFLEFKKKHGVEKNCIPAPQEIVEIFQTKLPSSLIEEWKETGWCSYGKGLIWIVNPLDFQEIIEEWLFPNEDALVFGRTAFGDLLIWRNNEVQYIYTQYAKIAPLTSNLTLFFEYSLCSDGFLDPVLDRKLFQKAYKKLGQLDFDECYGFEPVLALGESGTIDTIRKVKLQEYLSLLSQVVGRNE